MSTQASPAPPISQVQQWMRAKNRADLLEKIQNQEKEQVTKTLCLLQLKKNKVPYSCYQWLSTFSIEGLKNNTVEEGAPNRGLSPQQKKTKGLKSAKAKGTATEGLNPRSSLKALKAYLDEKCSSAIPHLKDLKEISKIQQTKHLSQFCKEQVEQRKKVREYQLRDSAPSTLFEWYTAPVPN